MLQLFHRKPLILSCAFVLALQYNMRYCYILMYNPVSRHDFRQTTDNADSLHRELRDLYTDIEHTDKTNNYKANTVCVLAQNVI